MDEEEECEEFSEVCGCGGVWVCGKQEDGEKYQQDAGEEDTACRDLRVSHPGRV